MTLLNAKTIIDRALQDVEYQNLLFANPKTALQGYELTEAETEMFLTLSSSPYTSARRGLMETRKLIQAAMDYIPDEPQG
ncbi:MAG: hypothetical protein HZC38_13465 [Chloroflexi bacterium]|nr:hypothetical protein [Chloroflexota bacterium]